MKQTKRNDLRRLGLGYSGYPQKTMKFVFCVPLEDLTISWEGSVQRPLGLYL